MYKIINLFKMLKTKTKKRSLRTTYKKNKKIKRDTIPARSPKNRKLNFSFYNLKKNIEHDI